MASYCVKCHAEDQKIREERRYEKKLAYNRQWRKENRDKVNAYARANYEKNKDAINEKQRREYIAKEKKTYKRAKVNNKKSSWHKNKFVFGKIKYEKKFVDMPDSQ